MALKIGIVGLPNVGKSTLFNALTRTKSAVAANYPFCTIDPNIGIVEVPDFRLKKLSEFSKSAKTIPATIEFVDIAGLVKGASKGEGLGNKFLAHIRGCNAIAHIVRVFNDSNVIHVHGSIDPKIDKEVIESELIIADLQTTEKRLDKANADCKSGDKEKKAYALIVAKVLENLQKGVMAIDVDLSDEEKEKIKDLSLLTMKPNFYIINLSEEEIKTADKKKFAEILDVKDENKIIPVCAKIEEELGDLNEEEAYEYLKELGLKETGLNALIRTAYETLGLITYFTTGPKESRAWTIKKGTLAPQAAGVIHTDFEKGFIKAEIINWQKLLESGSEVHAKELGLLRIEGKEYTVQDGDSVHFRFAN
ncbi:MAG: redox-regulated ATPase YchF [Candidatus Gracilibacteria bacterium]|jgi:hypothetical protein